ncbi:hypothetical protein [Streptomyces sp. NPDC001389]|uniref:guanylate kinase n=1 Tax=Streptomyces sp. NPDC001389 TaxID=3364569 RepID=UPI0036816DEB
MVSAAAPASAALTGISGRRLRQFPGARCQTPEFREEFLSNVEVELAVSADPKPFLIRPTGCLFVLSGPSGTGKTSLSRAMVAADPTLAGTRSVTTREPRPGGGEEHYDHVTRDEFLKMAGNGEFVQWIHPSFDEYYGTLLEPVRQALDEGRDLVLDYCPEGYLNLKRAFPEQTVGVFVMAPSVRMMDRRLAGRGSENEQERELRHTMALRDFNFVDRHDYHVVNDDFEETLATLMAIRRAEKARLAHQRGVLAAYARHAEPALLRYY